jgi:CubicO group peptidase (beta-lactamase class C family)
VRWRVLFELGLSLMITASAIAQNAKEKAERIEAIRVVDAWMDGEQAYRHMPAVSVAIVVGDRTEWAKGYGYIDAEQKVPAATNTIYSVCSISKLFTSVALMQLYESDRVRLDEPLTTYLPWAKLRPAEGDSAPVTLRGVLSHSSGLPRESPFPYWSNPDHPFPTREQIQVAVTTQSALYPAERYFQYSNLGFVLAGETVEAVSGEPFAQYVSKHVLAPLKLTDTRAFLPLDLYGKRLAVGYDSLQRNGTRNLLKPFDTRGMLPAAGYTSTVEDIARFASWQFRLLSTEKANVLKASTLREMQRVQFVDSDWKTYWGLGFEILRIGDHTYVGHDGGCPGYSTGLRLRPEDHTAVVFMNNTAEAAGPFLTGVFAILDRRKGYSFKEPDSIPKTDLEAYTGHYSNQPFGAEGVMLPWAGGLAYLALPTIDPATAMTFLKPKGRDVFRRVRDDDSEAEEYSFQRDATGKVIAFYHFDNPHRRLGP